MLESNNAGNGSMKRIKIWLRIKKNKHLKFHFNKYFKNFLIPEKKKTSLPYCKEKCLNLILLIKLQKKSKNI